MWHVSGDDRLGPLALDVLNERVAIGRYLIRAGNGRRIGYVGPIEETRPGTFAARTTEGWIVTAERREGCADFASARA